MKHIPIYFDRTFDEHIIELSERLYDRRHDAYFLSLYGTGTVTVDAALGFYDVVRTRPRGVKVHIHSHVCLQGADILIWLAGDTRTLRGEAWIHFREYPRHWMGRTAAERFQEELEKRDRQLDVTPFQENYLTVERLMKKHLPTHLWNRRVWGGELEEWNIIKQVAPVGHIVETEKPAASAGDLVEAEPLISRKPAVRKATGPRVVEKSGKATQMGFF